MSEKVNKKKVTRKKEEKKILTTDNILLIVFGILLITVFVLAAMVFNKSRENKDKVNANLVVPIFEINAEESISLTTALLAKEDEYVLKVTNYKNDKVIAEKVNYSVIFENDSKAVIKVTRNNDEENLIKDQKKTVIENQKLKKNEREEVYYHISVTKTDGIKKDDKVNIKIAS